MATRSESSAGMRVVPSSLSGVLVLEPAVFRDNRGFLVESYNRNSLDLAGISAEFVQENHIRSFRGVIRGLHYQLPPRAQGKLVRVPRGEVFDVAVDVRRGSPTFGRWTGVTLTSENLRMLWIPPGFAHGCLALSDEADITYLTTDFYVASAARTLRWDDSSIRVDWPLDRPPILSPADANGVPLSAAEVFD